MCRLRSYGCVQCRKANDFFFLSCWLAAREKKRGSIFTRITPPPSRHHSPHVFAPPVERVRLLPASTRPSYSTQSSISNATGSPIGHRLAQCAQRLSIALDTTAAIMPRKPSRLFGLLPSVRWVPSDISSQEPSSSSSRSPPKPRVTFFVRARKSTISLASEPDADVGARTHAQGQSAFFAKMPLELRREVYGYVVGSETVHLTLGAKKRFGHFVCEDACALERKGRDCKCRVLVGGRKSEKLNAACLNMLVVCRRMYVCPFNRCCFFPALGP